MRDGELGYPEGHRKQFHGWRGRQLSNCGVQDTVSGLGSRDDPAHLAREKTVYNLVLRHSAAFLTVRTNIARLFRRSTTHPHVRDTAPLRRRQESRAHGMGQ